MFSTILRKKKLIMMNPMMIIFDGKIEQKWSYDDIDDMLLNSGK
jgi:hypothetical protein